MIFWIGDFGKEAFNQQSHQDSHVLSPALQNQGVLTNSSTEPHRVQKVENPTPVKHKTDCRKRWDGSKAAKTNKGLYDECHLCVFSRSLAPLQLLLKCDCGGQRMWPCSYTDMLQLLQMKPGRCRTLNVCWKSESKTQLLHMKLRNPGDMCTLSARGFQPQIPGNSHL